MPSLIALFPRQVKGIQTLIFALKLGHLLTEEFHYMNGQSTGSVQKIPSPILRYYFFRFQHLQSSSARSRIQLLLLMFKLDSRIFSVSALCLRRIRKETRTSCFKKVADLRVCVCVTERERERGRVMLQACAVVAFIGGREGEMLVRRHAPDLHHDYSTEYHLLPEKCFKKRLKKT